MSGKPIFQTLLNEKSKLTDETKHELENLEQTPLFSELDFKITSAEIIHAGKRLNKKASAGPDKISGKLLIEGLAELLPVIMQLFNKIFSHATIVTQTIIVALQLVLACVNCLVSFF